MRTLPILLAFASLPVLAAGLNDTGVTLCYNGTGMVTCTSANTGDAAAYPRQDARFGRDAAQATGQLAAKTGGGAAGFDFTPLDATGKAIAIVSATDMPASTPSCVRDNVTGLIWEGKVASNSQLSHTWANAFISAGAANTAGLCGFTSGWRVPTRRELLTIVHSGVNSPTIDTRYFQYTEGVVYYWTSDATAWNSAYAWGIATDDGRTVGLEKRYAYRVRLVRSGQ